MENHEGCCQSSGSEDVQHEFETYLEFTPNPNSLKFVTNCNLLPESETIYLRSLDQAQGFGAGEDLLKMDTVDSIMVGRNFVTVTKKNEASWAELSEAVPAILKKRSGEAGQQGGLLKREWLAQWQQKVQAQKGANSEIEQKISQILDTDIRPFVAMDGGDIQLERYDDGIVYLKMHGACSHCPSSTATLKHGVERRLKELMPEIREVVA